MSTRQQSGNPSDPDCQVAGGDGEERFKDVKKSVDDHTDLSEKMLDLYNNKEFSDVVLRVGKFEFPAHRMILVNSSEYFQRMFAQNWKEKDQKIVNLEEEEGYHKFFEGFLKYIYTNQLEISLDSVLCYHTLADKYMVTSLKYSCLEFMIDNFNVNPDIKRVMAWMKCADRDGGLEFELQEKLMLFIAWNLRLFALSNYWCDFNISLILDLLRSDDLVVPDEFTLHQWAIRWLKLTEPDEKMLVVKLKEMLPLIRFQVMPVQHLDELLDDDFVKIHSDHYLSQHVVPAFRYHTKTEFLNLDPTPLRIYTDNHSLSKTKVKQGFCISYCRTNYQTTPYECNSICIKNLALCASPSNADINEKNHWTITSSTQHCLNTVYSSSDSDTIDVCGDRPRSAKRRRVESMRDTRLDIIMKHKLKQNVDESRNILMNFLVRCKQGGVVYIKKVATRQMRTNKGKGTVQMWRPTSSDLLKQKDTEYLIDGAYKFMLVLLPNGREVVE
uniref:BTB/POZ domain-containing protein 17-like n=1 Tax=Saccoglossus kowalevskii TaxID=10224 RepID=A0ABM0MCD7_SACKO|nr:PREDICTED: BTB/POZ domain-containing protein 17-like [Saccoglossus kowalevskii]